MAIYELSFAATRVMIDVVRKALSSDPLFQPGGAGPSRSAETIVLDAWGLQVRDFPCTIITGKPGKFRRMGIGGGKVRPFFGVSLVEEPGGTSTSRTFDVSLVCVVGSNLTLVYNGANASALAPQAPFVLPVQQKIVGGNPVNYVVLTGTNIGPAATFPLASFGASSPNYPTGMIFGGMYDMSMELTASARNTQTRDLLTDRLSMITWLEKKRELQKFGLTVLDVAHAGFAKDKYGADLIYQSKLKVDVALEFAAVAQYVSTVTDIGVTATAVDVLVTAPST